MESNSNLTKLTLTENFKIIYKILIFMLRKFPISLLITVFSSSINALIPALSIKVTKMIIDDLSLYLKGDSSITFGMLVVLVLIEFGLYGLEKLISGFLDFYNARFTRKKTQFLKEIFIKKTISQPYILFENPDTYNKMNLVKNSIPQVTSSINYLIGIFTSAVRLVSLASIIISYSRILLVAILIVNIINIYIGFRMYIQRQRFEFNSINRLKYVNYIEEILTSYKYIKDIKLWNLGDYFSKKYMEKSNENYTKEELFTVKKRMNSSISGAASKISYYSLYIYTIYNAFIKKCTLGDVMTFKQSYSLIEGSISSLISGTVSMFYDNIYAKRYFDYINEDIYCKPSKKQKKLEKHVENKLDDIKKIEFRNVSFSFENIDRDIISDISLTINKGETVSILGENGCGKTTFVKLLTGLFVPTKGAIYVNDIPLTDIKDNEYLRHLGVLFRDFNKYHFSCKENILLGNVENISDEDMLEATLDNANIRDLVESLNNGIDTPLSNYLEKGQTISSGEWEKVAVARLYFRNPNVIILDEPTTNVDNYYNSFFFKDIRNMSKNNGKIVILINHNLEYTKIADKIIFMKDGRVVETGTHNELMELKGFYYELWESGKMDLD